MCLEAKSPIEKSEQSIKVWKRLNLAGRAPYRGTLYRRGELKQVPYFTNWNGTRFTKVGTVYKGMGVYKGLHAYTLLRNARAHGGIVVACTIPRRTPFIRGKYGEIVALKLKVGKALGKGHYVEQFNKRGKNGKVSTVR